MKLDELRVQIDAVDKSIVELFSKRMEICRDIALCKKAEGRNIFDPEREKKKLSQIAGLSSEAMRDYTESLYSLIMELSKDFQEAVLAETERDYSGKCFGLLGEKLGHSFSPQIHGMLANYEYRLYPVERDDLELFLAMCPLDGLNVTIPYKKDVLPMCSYISEPVKRIGSANTLVKKDNGWHAYNTDYVGFKYMVQSSGCNVAGEKVAVLGSGGASLAVQAALEDMGVGEIVVISRNGENNYSNLQLNANATIVVNTTPVGMYPNVGKSPVSLESFPQCKAVFDIIYNPARTELIMQAEEKGLQRRSGLSMLVAQAHSAAELFTGRNIPKERIEEIISALENQTQNIVLIGMPGCGKSSVGRELEILSGRKFVDADEYLREKCGMSAADMISEMGEQYFRQQEKLVLEELGKQSGIIIATGGGCVTVEENYKHLHRNGKIFWRKRDLEKLPTQGRPLSQQISMQEMYEKRAPLYERFADFIIDNDGDDPMLAAKMILEAMQ